MLRDLAYNEAFQLYSYIRVKQQLLKNNAFDLREIQVNNKAGT